MEIVKFVPSDRREALRLRAWELKQSGWKQKDIASSLGVSQTAVSNWIRRAHRGGTISLRTRHSPGAPPRLNKEQKITLINLLEQGPSARGFRNRNWTYNLIANFITQKFGVSYHQSHIPKLLNKLSWIPPHRRQNPMEPSKPNGT